MEEFAEWRALGRRFTHNGHQIFWRENDSGVGGADLLCIHGFPTASWDWHALWPGLCARFGRVLAPDMIGFGWSAKPRHYAYSIADQADLHEQLLREHGIGRVHLLAHDYGDTVAQEMLARAAQRRAVGDETLVIESVCLLNGGLFPETHRPRPIQRLLASSFGPLISRFGSERAFCRSLAAVFGPETKPSVEELDRFWRLWSTKHGQRNGHKLIRYMAERRAHRERWVGALVDAEMPVRLIAGLRDPVSGAHMVRRYRELVPGPDVVELPDIGHYPQIEAPQETLRAFIEFHDSQVGGQPRKP
ncbi:alpha/beta fold hydrolase [Nocardia donostiensis]|uniref:Alpha/beta hydrolase n=1 Tax=Nocardia donostiensis TaxID=1538463 RepID=A0A1W0AYZ2_9NOCA|nr:alpha/beta hydrolase [Nocardia donostiensis]ONM48905.1 alpha/beta hydrolase [Nocardia donostiensis]OQS15475.1 alpha/beta hydrolase [Nocardia donostiensis]OQS22839.1 alpha/beta hydrolase [Nocardia donostiensis]